MPHFDPELGRSVPPTPEVPAVPHHPHEQATRDMDQAAFLAALIPALIIILASIAMIFALQP